MPKIILIGVVGVGTSSDLMTYLSRNENIHLQDIVVVNDIDHAKEVLAKEPHSDTKMLMLPSETDLKELLKNQQLSNDRVRFDEVFMLHNYVREDIGFVQPVKPDKSLWNERVDKKNFGSKNFNSRYKIKK